METAITVPINPKSFLSDPTPLQTLRKGGGCVDGRNPSVPGDRTRQLLGGVEGEEEDEVAELEAERRVENMQLTVCRSRQWRV